MTKDTTKAAAVAADIMLFDNWFDPIEDGVRARVRGFIETMLEEELTAVLSRPRYVRRKVSGNEESTASPLIGCRHGHRKRTLTGTFGKGFVAKLLNGRERPRTRNWFTPPAHRTVALDVICPSSAIGPCGSCT
jgi:hypothetical protein